VYVLEGEWADLAASRGGLDIEFVLGLDTVTVIPIRDSVSATLSLLYHEAFHGYQRRRFVASRRPLEAFGGAVISTPEYEAAAEVERRILLATLHEEDRQTVAHLLRAYLAVRRHRTQSLPVEVQVVERHLERMEGSAEFVGHRMRIVALNEQAEQLVHILERRLTDSLRAPNVANKAHWRHRYRIYGTGATIALWLDRWNPTWEQALERGRDFEELLSEAVDFRAIEADSLAEEAMRDFGFEELVRHFRDWARRPARAPTPRAP
jgi:hypothetical protein